jgi:hypothetical protein
MAMFKYPILIIVLSLPWNYLSAQQCDLSRMSSTPNDSFYINDNGTITELETGLTWMRCAVGQSWNGHGCKGEPQRFNWRQAVSAGDTQPQTRWRLPTLAELATIVERQCRSPRINETLFPDTPQDMFWTASNKRGTKGKAYALGFGKQGVTIADQQEKHYIRLVSGRN